MQGTSGVVASPISGSSNSHSWYRVATEIAQLDLPDPRLSDPFRAKFRQREKTDRYIDAEVILRVLRKFT